MTPKRQFNYGYVVVASATLMMLLAFGTFYSYSVFFKSLSNEFHLNSAATSVAFSIATLISGAMGIFAGRISDRVGPRKISIFSSIALGVGYLLMSRVNAAWQVYLIYGLLLAVGVGVVWPASLSTIARWFKTNRGLMSGIATAGVGLGTAVFPPLLSHLVLNYSWRTTYIIIGLVVLVIMTLLAFLLRQEPSPSFTQNSDSPASQVSLPEKNEFTFREALHTRQFWMVNAIFLLFGYSQFSLTVHMVPLGNSLGISPVSSAVALALIGGLSIFGRIIAGFTGDKVRIKLLLLLIAIIFILSLTWLQFSRQQWSLYTFAVFFGLAYGGSATMQSLLGMELFGLKSLGIFIGGFVFAISIGGGCGPIITGYIYDVTGSYQWALLVCILASVTAFVLAVFLTPPSRVSSSNITRSYSR